MATIAIAGILKLADLPSFLHELQRWRTLTNSVAAMVVVVVPVLEVTVPTLWLFGIGRRWLTATVLLMLVLYSAGYVAEWTSGAPPKCGCFGRWVGSSWLDRPQVVLGRNVVLMGLLGTAIFLGRRSALSRATGIGADPRGVSIAPRAFSLTELLAVIAILAIIVALTIPHLQGVRTRAVDARELAYLKNHCQIFAIYSNDFEEAYPFLTQKMASPPSSRVKRPVFRERCATLTSGSGGTLALRTGTTKGRSTIRHLVGDTCRGCKA